jgi:hypothetical protein
MKPSEKSESEEYMMGDAYRVAKQAYDKKDKTMTTRDAGLTQEQVEAAEVHAAGSSHCGEIKSKSAFSRDSTEARLPASGKNLPAEHRLTFFSAMKCALREGAFHAHSAFHARLGAPSHMCLPGISTHIQIQVVFVFVGWQTGPLSCYTLWEREGAVSAYDSQG